MLRGESWGLDTSAAMGFSGTFPTAAGGFDHFPEFGIFLERFVFLGLEAGAEEEILEGMAAEDAVDEQAEVVPLEIDAVIADAETVQDAPALHEPAEFLQLSPAGLLRQPAELAEDLQLKFFGHARQFGGAGWRKNDLEWMHTGLIS